MTTIRDLSGPESEFASVFKATGAQANPFAHAFEVFWQLAKEEHPGWSFDERQTWAEDRAAWLVREHDQPHYA